MTDAAVTDAAVTDSRPRLVSAVLLLGLASLLGCASPATERPRVNRVPEPVRAMTSTADADSAAQPDSTSNAEESAAPEPRAAATRRAAREENTPRVLATVGDRVVDANDLADAALYFFRESYYESLAYLIGREIARAEATRLGVRVERDEIDREVVRELDQQRNELRVQFGGEVTLEEFVADNFGEDAEAYRSRVQAIVRDKMLRDRVIRFSLLRDGFVDVRELALEDRARAEEIRAAALEGADFATLVEKHSVLSTRRNGGLVAKVRAGFFPAPIESAVSNLGPGEVSPVLEVERDGRTLYHLYRVIRRVPGDRVPFGAVRDLIVAELEDSPVTSLEVLQWNRSRERLYPVRRGRP